MTIWVFGCSLSTAFNVELDQCWPQIVAKSLGTFFNPLNKVCVPKSVSDELRRRKGEKQVDDYLNK